MESSYKWDLVQEEPIRLIGNEPNRARFFVLKKESFIKFIGESDIFWDFSPELLEEINKYVSEHKPAELRRGDVVALPSQEIGGTYPSRYGYNYRNDGKMIYDGGKLIDLRVVEDDYGMLPESFTINEFNYIIDYWDNVICHNGFIWMDVSQFEMKKVTELRTEYENETYYLFTHKKNPNLKYFVLHEVEFTFDDDFEAMISTVPTLFENIVEKSYEGDEYKDLQTIRIMPRHDQYKKLNTFKHNLSHVKYVYELNPADFYTGINGKYTTFNNLRSTKALPARYISKVIQFETKDKIPSGWIEVDTIEFIKLLPINDDEKTFIDKLVSRMISYGVE